MDPSRSHSHSSSGTAPGTPLGTPPGTPRIDRSAVPTGGGGASLSRQQSGVHLIPPGHAMLVPTSSSDSGSQSKLVGDSDLERVSLDSPRSKPEVVGDSKIDIDKTEALNWQEANRKSIKAMQDAGIEEKSVWAKRYTDDKKFRGLIDTYVKEYAELHKGIQERTLEPEDIAAKANKLAMRLGVAYGFIDQEGFTKATKDDCMEAGKTFAGGSIKSNYGSQAPGAARYLALSATGAFQAFTGLTAAKSRALASVLAGIGSLYTGIQLAGSFLGPLYNAAVQSEYGKQQTHLEPPFWPNIKPSEIVDEHGAALPSREELETRIRKLESNDPTWTIPDMVGDLGKKIALADKRIERYKKNEAKYGAKLKLWTKQKEQLKKTETGYTNDLHAAGDDFMLKSAQRQKAIYDLKAQLEIVKLYHNLNAGEMQGYGRALRQVFNMANPVLSIIGTAAGGAVTGPTLIPALQLAIQVGGPALYHLYHGYFGGKDALDRLATCLQLAVLNPIGNLAVEGKTDQVDLEKLDAFGKGPMLLRLEGQKKILQFNARVHILAMLANLADSQGNLPGGDTLLMFDAKLKKCESSQDRKDLLNTLSTACAQVNSGDAMRVQVSQMFASACLERHEEALQDLVLVEDAMKSGDPTQLFSPACHLTVDDKRLLLNSLQFASNRLEAYAGGARDPKIEKASRGADTELAVRIAQTERQEWVGAMHQGMQKLGESWLGGVYGGGGPNLIQAVLSLTSAANYALQAVTGKALPHEATDVVSYVGSGVSVLASLVGTRTGWTGVATYAVKNDARMRDKEITGTLPNVPVMGQFPRATIKPTEVSKFTTLGGTAPAQRVGMTLKIQTPQSGYLDFKAHVNSMPGPLGLGFLGPHKIFQTSRSVTGGKLDMAAIAGIYGQPGISGNGNVDGNKSSVVSSSSEHDEQLEVGARGELNRNRDINWDGNADGDTSSFVSSSSQLDDRLVGQVEGQVHEVRAHIGEVNALMNQLVEINVLEASQMTAEQKAKFFSVLKKVDMGIADLFSKNREMVSSMWLERSTVCLSFFGKHVADAPPRTVLDLADSVANAASSRLDNSNDRALVGQVLLPLLVKTLNAMNSTSGDKIPESELVDLDRKVATLFAAHHAATAGVNDIGSDGDFNEPLIDSSETNTAAPGLVAEGPVTLQATVEGTRPFGPGKLAAEAIEDPVRTARMAASKKAQRAEPSGPARTEPATGSEAPGGAQASGVAGMQRDFEELRKVAGSVLNSDPLVAFTNWLTGAKPSATRTEPATGSEAPGGAQASVVKKILANTKEEIQAAKAASKLTEIRADDLTTLSMRWRAIGSEISKLSPQNQREVQSEYAVLTELVASMNVRYEEERYAAHLQSLRVSESVEASSQASSALVQVSDIQELIQVQVDFAEALLKELAPRGDLIVALRDAVKDLGARVQSLPASDKTAVAKQLDDLKERIKTLEASVVSLRAEQTKPAKRAQTVSQPVISGQLAAMNEVLTAIAGHVAFANQLSNSSNQLDRVAYANLVLKRNATLEEYRALKEQDLRVDAQFQKFEELELKLKASFRSAARQAANQPRVTLASFEAAVDKDIIEARKLQESDRPLTNNAIEVLAERLQIRQSEISRLPALAQARAQLKLDGLQEILENLQGQREAPREESISQRRRVADE